MKKIVEWIIISFFIIILSGITYASPYQNTTAYYKLNETNGSIAYNYYGAPNGQNKNGNIVTGILDNALNFTGTGFINITDNVNNSPTSAMTLRGWVKYNSYIPGGGTIFSKWNDPSNNAFLIKIGTNSIRGLISCNGAYAAGMDLTGAIVINPGTWYHVVMTFNGTNMSIYVNGVLDVSTTFASCSIYDSTTNLRIGAETESNALINGTVDEILVANYAWNESEVRADYNSGVPTTLQQPPFPISILSATTAFPLNQTYWKDSLPNFTGVCTAGSSANINASLYINGTYYGSSNVTNTTFSYTIVPTNGLSFFNEYSWYVNCSIASPVYNSMISSTRYFYYANSSGCTGTVSTKKTCTFTAGCIGLSCITGCS